MPQKRVKIDRCTCENTLLINCARGAIFVNASEMLSLPSAAAKGMESNTCGYDDVRGAVCTLSEDRRYAQLAHHFQVSYNSKYFLLHNLPLMQSGA